MSSRTVLAIDLSTAHGEIAVARGDAIVFEAGFQSERSHNAQVFAPLREALVGAGGSLDLIVVGTGPGSYTGVRIAIAAAQGVALSRSVPAIGWPSIAAPHAGQAAYQIIGDARRGAFYLAQVIDGQLVQGFEIVDAETARSRAASGEWLTFDPRVPLDLPGVRQERPSAARLAIAGLRLSQAEVAARCESPLQPLYLQDAFITTARKAGKLVPATQ